MKRVLFLLFAICLSSPKVGWAQLSSQAADHWYFGNGYGLDFSQGEVQADYDHAMNTFECACAMSDEKGNLLYYTNGGGRNSDQFQGFIWNRLHQPMEGGALGTTMGGGYSAAQGCITFPKPGHPGHYLLFTVDEQETLQDGTLPFPSGKGLRSFEIDMNANGGLGKVITSNQDMGQVAFEYIAATQHSNCTDFWLFVPTGHFLLENQADAADTLMVYAITENGISLHQQWPIPTGEPDQLEEYGPIKVSPDGRHLTMGSFLYRFDAETGFIQGETHLQSAIMMGMDDPLVFSGDSRFLYRFRREFQDSTHRISVIQYDLDAPNWPQSDALVDKFEYKGILHIGIPQLAPDQRIYLPLQYNFFTNPTDLAVIHHPMKRGEDADFEERYLTLDKPNNKRIIHLGNFTDHLFDYRPTLEIEISGRDTLSCDSLSLTLLKAPPGFDQYLWSTGARDSVIVVDQAGTYWVQAGDACQFGADTIQIVFRNDSLRLDLGPDLTACTGEQVQIIPQLNFEPDRYHWQDGSAFPVLVDDTSTSIQLEAFLGNCIFQDSLQIDRLGLPTVDLGVDTLLCDEQTLRLSTPPTDGLPIYIWQDGSAAAFYDVTTPGPYYVQISNACGEATDSINVFMINCSQKDCEVFVPNIFTPNGDGNNDRFEIFSNCNFEQFRLEIFSRWGDLVFASDRLENHWDGMLKGKPCPSGVYVYRLQYRLVDEDGIIYENVRTGDITLMR